MTIANASLGFTGNLLRNARPSRGPEDKIAGTSWVNKIVDLVVDPNQPASGLVDDMLRRAGMFLVGVRMVGGDAGDASNRCTYTYDLYNLRTDPQRTTKINVDPVEMKGFGQRIVMAAMVDGEVGIAFRDHDKVLWLIWVDESFEQTDCTDQLGSGPGDSAAYATGTPYTLTATPAAIDFGTDDPSAVLASTRNYLIQARVNLKYNGATFAANRTVTLKLRRTSGTPADIANSTTTVVTEVVTTHTGTFQTVLLPPVVYSATTGDVLTIYGSIDVVPSAGSLDVVEACVVPIPL